jgi:hypothetical protein
MISTSSTKVHATEVIDQGTGMCFEEVGEVVDHCDKLLQQATKIINDQNKQLKLQQMLAQDLIQDQQALIKRAVEAEESKNSWYRNPLVVGALGLAAGAAGALILDRGN